MATDDIAAMAGPMRRVGSSGLAAGEHGTSWGAPQRAPQDCINYQTHCFWVEEVVVFVPSLCWVVVLLLDCPVWGFDVAALSVVLDGSTVVVRLSFCPVGCSVVVVFELVWANAGPRTTMHPKAASAAIREIDPMLPPVSTPQRHSIRMAITRRPSGITKEGLNRYVAHGTVDFANGRLSF
jgi:hypothetical protein